MKTLIACLGVMVSVAAHAAPEVPGEYAFGRTDTVVASPRVAVGTGWMVAESYGSSRSYLYKDCTVRIDTIVVGQAAGGSYPQRMAYTIKCGNDGLAGPAYTDLSTRTFPANGYSSAEVTAQLRGKLSRDGIQDDVYGNFRFRYLANHATGAVQYDLIGADLYW